MSWRGDIAGGVETLVTHGGDEAEEQADTTVLRRSWGGPAREERRGEGRLGAGPWRGAGEDLVEALVRAKLSEAMARMLLSTEKHENRER